MDIQSLKGKFIRINGGKIEDILVFFAPGRVNLIGEHTDYNGGYVLPCSLNFGTYLLARPSLSTRVKFKSLNFNMTAEICMNKEIIPIGDEWINYPLGVIKEFQDKGIQVPGMELLYAGNIPNGAGLSSSASIEIVTAFAINQIMQENIPKIEMIKMAQHAENNFVGMNCGIMDQFAVTMGKKEKAIFLNCDTLEYDLIPVSLGDYRIIISNTNKRRQLADSEYNKRRAECEQAVNDLNKYIQIKNLSQIDEEAFIEFENKISDPIVRNRARHVVTENKRVAEAVKALKENDLELFGQFMYASHESLKNDYEVSCSELDILVEEAAKLKGVLGSRMTGGGFGGCTVSIVHTNHIETFKQQVGKIYTERTDLNADFYTAEIGEGVHIL